MQSRKYRKYALKKAVVVIQSNHQYTNFNVFFKNAGPPKAPPKYI